MTRFRPGEVIETIGPADEWTEKQGKRLRMVIDGVGEDRYHVHQAGSKKPSTTVVMFTAEHMWRKAE